MQQDFRSTVTQLWRRLGLGEPRFNEPGRIQLRIDRTSLDLTDNGRGRLVVEGIAGALPAGGPEAARRIRRVLQTNLGFLLGNEAGVYTKNRQGETVLAVRAGYAYSLGNPDRLKKTIEDTLRVIDYYAAEFASAPSPAAPAGARGVAEETMGAVIFRP
jgi:hypothetical protein